jgi:hypothetical protein|tara:strand:+ start:1060 stop:1548 length:489 start_codon:yes stop_codon:yes gene_type:complete
LSEDKKDNVIQFPGPKDKETEIVFEPDPGLDYNSTEKNLVDTMEFVESCVDDLSITLIKNFVDIGVKIEKPQFFGDLAMVSEMIRVLLYRDFDVEHIGQALIDKMIKIKFDEQGQPIPVLNYSKVLENVDLEKTKAEITRLNYELEQFELDLFPGDDDGKNT